MGLPEERALEHIARALERIAKALEARAPVDPAHVSDPLARGAIRREQLGVGLGLVDAFPVQPAFKRHHPKRGKWRRG